MNEKEGKLLVYNLPNGKAKVDILLAQDNIWMSQAALADLYQTSTQNITKHIRNIYDEGELEKNATCNSQLQVQMEGNREVKRNINFYNLNN